MILSKKDPGIKERNVYLIGLHVLRSCVGSLQPDNYYDGSSRDPEVARKLVKAKQQGTSAAKRDKGRGQESNGIWYGHQGSDHSCRFRLSSATKAVIYRPGAF
jgi:hypothetical protein